MKIKLLAGETSKQQRPFKPNQFAHKTPSNDCPMEANCSKHMQAIALQT